jgi:hypothetical protein
MRSGPMKHGTISTKLLKRLSNSIGEDPRWIKTNGVPSYTFYIDNVTQQPPNVIIDLLFKSVRSAEPIAKGKKDGP